MAKAGLTCRTMRTVIQIFHFDLPFHFYPARTGCKGGHHTGGRPVCKRGSVVAVSHPSKPWPCIGCTPFAYTCITHFPGRTLVVHGCVGCWMHAWCACCIRRVMYACCCCMHSITMWLLYQLLGAGHLLVQILYRWCACYAQSGPLLGMCLSYQPFGTRLLPLYVLHHYRWLLLGARSVVMSRQHIGVAGGRYTPT